jgi:putative Mg2+ transporter-C (MgtC) family protein
MHVNINDVYSLFVALGLGAVLGLEREYRSKAAGFRTLIMISVGSCLFTILSRYIGSPGNPDRIASNVVQGIGFLGAGVIFKDNLSVSGLTTATAIWVASAIGMAAGAGNWQLACITTVSAFVVLAGFELIQRRVDLLHQRKDYKLTFRMGELSTGDLERDFARVGVKFFKLKESRDRTEVTCWYEVFGKASRLLKLDEVLLEDQRVLAFDN